MFEATKQIANSSTDPLEVWFEPWGMPYTLQPGESFRVVAESEKPGQLETEFAPTGVVVYGWPGCTMKVLLGDVLVEEFSSKVPDVPPGLSVKSFIGLMFGGPGNSMP